MKKKYQIIFISDLEHSAPRISNFIHYLSKEKNFNISLIGSDYKNYLNNSDLPKNFEKNFKSYLFKRKINLMSWFKKYYVSKYQTKNITKEGTIKTDKSSFRKIVIEVKSFLVNIYLRLNFPDQYFFTVFKYLSFYKKVFHGHDTIIISSSPYPSSHIAAFLIKKKYQNIKWIADYRDLWSFNHNYSFGFVRKKLDYCLEKTIIKKCDIITTVSKPWAYKLNKIFKKETHVIRNGFSINKENKNIDLLSKNTNKKYFLYVGTISFNIHDVDMFFEGIRKYIENNGYNQLEIHFCGNYSDQLELLIRKYNLEKIVYQIGRFSRNDTILLQKKYDFLFYFDCLVDDGVLLLKFYEYINACRPILAFGNNSQSESSKILRLLNRGIYFKSAEMFNKFLIKMSNDSNFNLEPQKNKNYSYKYQSEILKKLIKEKF